MLAFPDGKSILLCVENFTATGSVLKKGRKLEETEALEPPGDRKL